jgi:transcriptional regulator with PAS, ATPase and Fis domain
MHRQTVSIEQKILPTGKRILATSNPVFNQAGEIVLVTSLLYPWSSRGLKAAESKGEAHFTSFPAVNGMVFTSQVMQQVITRAVKAASTDATILISGESGVGKEVLAKIIHQLSPRKRKPFITVNMTNIPEELFESELFGYKRGAFTGALNTGKAGLVEAAAGGTLFLDEISEIPLSCQAKLLRLLQEKEVLPVGSSGSKRVDVRFLAATNRDLESLVQSGRFREDLYYRLNAIPVYIPPLRERREDICCLIEHFMRERCRTYHTRKRLTSAALQVLVDYPWPGNVREMLNVVDRLFVIHPQEEVDGTMVVEEVFLGQHRSTDRLQTLLTDGLQETVDNFEKEIIESVLRKCNGDLERAAKTLSIHRTTLFRKLQKYRLKALPAQISNSLRKRH